MRAVRVLRHVQAEREVPMSYNAAEVDLARGLNPQDIARAKNPSPPENKKHGRQTEVAKYDPDAPIPDRGIDELFDLMVGTLNREMDMLSRQGPGFRPNQMSDLFKLSSAISAAYRARPGRPFDPLDQRADETIEEWKARLEALRG